MKRLLLLSVLVLLGSGPRAETYAHRDDVRAFVHEMHEKHGFDAEHLHGLFGQTKPIAAVIKAIMPPKDPAVRSWQAYRGRFVEPKRIAAGRRFMHVHAAKLATAETSFGVPAEIIAAVIGIETIYGRQMGRFGTFAALTTLAFDYPPRAELFRRELEELLLLAREEHRSPLAYTGSYAGALGLPQFLPSSRRRFAIDFDNDGRIDLTASAVDAIGSVANFMAAHGWEKDGPIAVAVNVAGDGVQALIDEGISPQRTPWQLEAANVSIAGVGAGDTAIANRPAALIDLITPGAATEFRLGYNNFYVITRYNRSSFYAAAVMDLAAELRASK
ncbi:MAG: membrane-bound lytic murein transglycosylase B [Rhodocyclaceae bacterium]|nr:MAG: membrane-bound lytic murein transglycosylase B [Rhodocyclaceae bacterium]TND05250.1 MAG: membrane-bound lytic murein transglycosylase B [Rhodocyclaceae bacterium]